MGRLVIVGASLAGLRAAEAAREAAFGGEIVLLGEEIHLPYDRPPLSKEFVDVAGDTRAPFFPSALTLKELLDVDIRLGVTATGLDPEQHIVFTDVGDVEYTRLIIATGASARRLPGTEHLAGVHSLRTLDDAMAVKKAMDADARTVVIGAGFIGSELASSARKRGLSATVVEALPVPLVRAVGEYAGEALAGIHRRNGTDLRLGVGVDGLEGDDAVTGVRLADGSVIAADLVVVGIGAVPSTGWLKESGLTIDNGLVADAALQAGPDIWVAGDVARWESPDFDRLMRLEHWTNAGDMGAHAAVNAVTGRAVPYHHIPYFWSDWYGSRIQFAGIAAGEPTIVHGAWDSDEFVALYREGERLAGVLTLNRRGDIMKYRNLIAGRATWDEGLAFADARRAAVKA